MVTVTLTPELERVIVECAEQQGTTPELYVLDELRTRYLPTMPCTSAEAHNHVTMLARRELLKLPPSERRRMLSEQAEKLKSHYETDTEWRELSEGDIVGVLTQRRSCLHERGNGIFALNQPRPTAWQKFRQ